MRGDTAVWKTALLYVSENGRMQIKKSGLIGIEIDFIICFQTCSLLSNNDEILYVKDALLNNYGIKDFSKNSSFIPLYLVL